ncbi:MAG: transposase [Clostridia bacterium]|nr:transposase [Clostridia bacterium]
MFDKSGFTLVDYKRERDDPVQHVTYRQDRDVIPKNVREHDCYLYSKRCPKCYSWNVTIHKKDHKTELHDLCENEDPNCTGSPRPAIPSKITVLRDRYQCSDCGKTFYLGKKLSGKRISEEYKTFITNEIINNESATYSDYSKVYGISRTEISKTFKEGYYNAEELIKKAIDCRDVYLYSFTYNREKRCAVVGIGADDGDKRLIDILESYDDNTIMRSLRNNFPNGDIIYNIFCTAFKKLIERLRKSFAKAEICILFQYINDLINGLRVDCADGIYGSKLNALSDFVTIIKSSTSKLFIDNFNKWWDELNDDLKIALSPVYTSVDACPKEWANAADYSEEEMKCDELFDVFQKFNKNNVPFESMRYRVMFLSSKEYVQQNTFGPPSGAFTTIEHRFIPYRYYCMRDRYTNYGVKINDIVEYYNNLDKIIKNKITTY